MLFHGYGRWADILEDERLKQEPALRKHMRPPQPLPRPPGQTEEEAAREAAISWARAARLWLKDRLHTLSDVLHSDYSADAPLPAGGSGGVGGGGASRTIAPGPAPPGLGAGSVGGAGSAAGGVLRREPSGPGSAFGLVPPGAAGTHLGQSAYPRQMGVAGVPPARLPSGTYPLVVPQPPPPVRTQAYPSAGPSADLSRAPRNPQPPQQPPQHPSQYRSTHHPPPITSGYSRPAAPQVSYPQLGPQQGLRPSPQPLTVSAPAPARLERREPPGPSGATPTPALPEKVAQEVQSMMQNLGTPEEALAKLREIVAAHTSGKLPQPASQPPPQPASQPPPQPPAADGVSVQGSGGSRSPSGTPRLQTYPYPQSGRPDNIVLVGSKRQVRTRLITLKPVVQTRHFPKGP